MVAHSSEHSREFDAILTRSIARKARESAAVKERFFEEQAGRIVLCCAAVAEKLSSGGRIFVMGNGGSACDANHLAVEFTHPILEKRRPFPAFSLTTDSALLSAVGNDNDFSAIFAAQLQLLGKAGDVAIGISTSGNSANVNRGIRSAKELGLLTVGFTGRDGGRLAGLCDFSFTVPSFSIHRIQETHVTLLHVIWDMVHVILGEEDIL